MRTLNSKFEFHREDDCGDQALAARANGDIKDDLSGMRARRHSKFGVASAITIFFPYAGGGAMRRGISWRGFTGSTRVSMSRAGRCGGLRELCPHAAHSMVVAAATQKPNAVNTRRTLQR
jgi:hypothetical protein